MKLEKGVLGDSKGREHRRAAAGRPLSSVTTLPARADPQTVNTLHLPAPLRLTAFRGSGLGQLGHYNNGSDLVSLGES